MRGGICAVKSVSLGKFAQAHRLRRERLLQQEDQVRQGPRQPVRPAHRAHREGRRKPDSL